MQLSDVNYSPLDAMRGVRRRVLKQKLKIPFALAVFLICLAAVLLLVVLQKFAILVIAFSYAGFEYYISNVKSKIWQEFARANNWRVLDKTETQIGFIPNCLSKLGRGYDVDDAIEVSLNNKSFYVYNMSFTTGSGKNSQIHFYTVAKLGLGKSLPNIVLDSKATYNLQNKNSQKVSLEGNFDQYFSMYIDKDQQINALSIITPDVMQTLVDLNKRYDVEIFLDNVYFIIEKDHRNAEDVKSLFLAVDALADELLFRARSYRADRVE